MCSCHVGVRETFFRGFPGGSDGKAPVCNAGDPDSIPGLGRSPGEGNGSPPQCSCLENPMDRGAWRAIVCGAAKSWTGLSDSTFFSSKNNSFVSSSSPLLYQFIFNWVLSFLLFILYWSVVASQSCVNSQVYSRGVPFVHDTYICSFSRERTCICFFSSLGSFFTGESVGSPSQPALWPAIKIKHSACPS